MKTSLFTLVMKNHSLEEVIEALARIGYDGIEPRGAEPHLAVDTPVERVKEICTLLDDAGLRTSCLATYTGGYSRKTDPECQQELDNLAKFLEFARILGCDLVRHGAGGPSPRQASQEQFERGVEWMQKAGDLAASAGCRLAIELHHGGLAESADDAHRLLKAVNRDNVGVILDPGNMYISHADYGEKAVGLLGDRIFHVHVKDELRVGSIIDSSCFAAGDEFYQHKLLGQGAVDHVPAFRALKELGYTGYLSCECHGPAEDQVAVAEHEYTELKRQLSLL